ncbi:very-long-chain 3-oxoacyl-CoA reductase-like, partial [Oppia nitens]|uniref:very-long-chain 3-oxoacyl-CoA reductase-like n=1 Tax=Oppia nitens TaxID=1686743 RepID=UPI0023DC9280
TIFIVIITAIRFTLIVWRLYLKRGFQWTGSPNTWAVVTGATDGIGLEFAKQLAEKGYNLLLISRSEHKLLNVKHDIECRHRECSVRVLAIDFTNSNVYEKIDNELRQLTNIQVLVNNVGMCYPSETPEYFLNIPKLNEFIPAILNVNVRACTQLIALVLPQMVASGRGVIINLSSATALHPVPLLSVYSATKVYIDYLSRSLHQEYKSKGIVIQSLVPAYISTNMSHNMSSNWFVPTARQYVTSALKTVGKEPRTSGYYTHRFFNFFNYWGTVSAELLGINFSLKVSYARLRGIRHRIIHKKMGNNNNNNNNITTTGADDDDEEMALNTAINANNNNND